MRKIHKSTRVSKRRGKKGENEKILEEGKSAVGEEEEGWRNVTMAKTPSSPSPLLLLLFSTSIPLLPIPSTKKLAGDPLPTLKPTCV